ncbi:YjjG family noncanonical pyrimidine nucleotidase [Salegentibacter sp. F188]|uniref:YjjG family noncanonical pyrimidine nucleotidase n=1 Tax=Autumnicola patrickiae TaxID=3075591 RepID=A0ABU3DY61_9FLAO|nr:YjjG family noncanonical pyrimidine nucleotidase [Salegentibacter sp. F188]MDT0688670.1 YjjG family noncanonical pyrimidine nucleotidase [Salegentibacter sp. F188]
MKLNKIEHVFFDLDHTLWDFDKNSSLTFLEIFKKWNISLKLEEFMEVYIKVNLKYWELYRDNRVSKEILRYGRLKDSFDSLKYTTSDDVIYGLSKDYIDFLPRNKHLLDGTLEILQYLKRKYKLHIITNGFEEVQRKKMATSGIAEFFHTITTSEEAGVKKPHLLIFKIALEKAGATAINSVMIGDNYEADILGSEKYGLQSIYFDYYRSSEISDIRQIQTLKDLVKFL